MPVPFEAVLSPKLLRFASASFFEAGFLIPDLREFPLTGSSRSWPDNFAGERGRLCFTKRFDVSRQNACANYQNQWCAPAQSKESPRGNSTGEVRSEEHTSELQSQSNLVCR